MMNKGFTKLHPAKKDPMQKMALSAATVASRLKQRVKPVPTVGGK